MSPGPSAPPPLAKPDGDLSPRYLLVIVVEIIVIAALYWIGRHFA